MAFGCLFVSRITLKRNPVVTRPPTSGALLPPRVKARGRAWSPRARSPRPALAAGRTRRGRTVGAHDSAVRARGQRACRCHLPRRCGDGGACGSPCHRPSRPRWDSHGAPALGEGRECGLTWPDDGSASSRQRRASPRRHSVLKCGKRFPGDVRVPDEEVRRVVPRKGEGFQDHFTTTGPRRG